MKLLDHRLNKQSFTPLYQQIKDLLIEQIESGELSDGDSIPSEVQFAAAFEVSRATIRQALYELRIVGIVSREKGRGTFVRVSVTKFATPPSGALHRYMIAEAPV